MLKDLKCTATTACCDGRPKNVHSEAGVLVDLQERLKGYKYQSDLAKELEITPSYLNDLLFKRRALRHLRCPYCSVRTEFELWKMNGRTYFKCKNCGHEIEVR
jgi:DNA-directed RNA polymerase subunit RPC12/RpoP